MDLILDSHIVVTRPDILSQGGQGIHFLMPLIAFQQFSVSRAPRRLKDLLQRASDAGRFTIIPNPSELSPTIRFGTGLDFTDMLILQAAFEYQKNNPSEKPFLVTDDREMLSLANKLGIQTATSKTVDDLIRSAPTGKEFSKELSDAAKLIERSARNYLIGGFVLGICVSAVLILAWYFRKFIGQTFPVWSIGFGAICLGTLLFCFRSRQRLAYGVVEIVFGIATAANLASAPNYDSTFFLQLVAGIYIIVRGFDNIENGIEGTKMEAKWKCFFRGRKATVE